MWWAAFEMQQITPRLIEIHALFDAAKNRKTIFLQHAYRTKIIFAYLRLNPPQTKAIEALIQE